MTMVQFRWATAEDQAGIVAISGTVYDDLDYIDDSYQDMIRNPRFYGMVGEINGEMVAFGGAYVHPHNQKMVTKLGRVKEKYRGQRIYGRLKERLVGEVTKLFPTLKTMEFFTGAHNPAINLLVRNEKYKQTFQQSLIIFKIPGSELTPQGVCANEIGVQGLSDLLNDPQKRSRIFPDKVFVVWDMYDPDVNEIQFIEAQKPSVLHSEYNNTDVVTIGGSYTSSRAGLIYVMQCHVPLDADVTDVEKALIGHIPRHVTIATSRMRGQCKLVFLAPYILPEAVHGAGLKLGLEKAPFFEDSLIGYSKDL